ncbi:MAG: AmmeMemoRadiSam system protein B [Nitrospirae bacterium]|nr:AmmeMemoRadiSam system protein B [Nitrospirota bacterium]
MKITRFLLIFTLVVVFLCACKADIKEPSVAGAFYPSDRNALTDMVGDFLYSAENKPEEGQLVALISPHAGYEFSGHVSAYGYKQLKGRDIKTVILIGSSHFHDFKGASVYCKGGFKTPLGVIKINEKLAKDLINKDADVGFYPEVYEKEHTLEVQLPFLQVVLKDFKILPILIGNPTRGSLEHLSEKLKEVMRKNQNVILIASTDLSHYHDYETALKMDGKLIDAIERLSIKDVEELLMSGASEMCGAYPVILTMRVAKELGANHGVLYKYANSGDVTSDKGRVVGYASMGVLRSSLTKEEKEELITLARKAITQYVSTGKPLEVEIKNPKLKAEGAVFVTITKGGRLRGCIGHIHAMMPLYKSVIKNAIYACSADTRFLPMTKQELSDIDVEISILTPLEPLKDIHSIQIGRDGIYIVKDGKSGILLPQVAVEFGWDKETFLRNLCLKAGLPKDAWKNGATLYRFTAEIIR